MPPSQLGEFSGGPRRNDMRLARQLSKSDNLQWTSRLVGMPVLRPNWQDFSFRAPSDHHPSRVRPVSLTLPISPAVPPKDDHSFDVFTDEALLGALRFCLFGTRV